MRVVGLDTEFSFRRIVVLPGGKEHVDATTLEPICCCMYFEDGRAVQLTDHYDRLKDEFSDPNNLFIVHNASAELAFCRKVGIPFPMNYFDTFAASLLIQQATYFKVPSGPYAASGLSAVCARYQIPFTDSDAKDSIRNSIMRGSHCDSHGLPPVVRYCATDAVACVRIYPHVLEELRRVAGPYAERNLRDVYQPYMLLMAEASARGLRFDVDAWDRLLGAYPTFRGKRLAELRQLGYAHDGSGVSPKALGKMLSTIGLVNEWPRTPGGRLCADEKTLDLFKNRHPAIQTLKKLKGFDSLMRQDLGARVDSDGKLRCQILPLEQHTSRNSVKAPNLAGIPGELRPLLLPDEGCVFAYFDFSQQEPGVAAALSGCRELLDDFSEGDVYLNLGRRIGLIRNGMSTEECKAIRGSVLKSLTLAATYGMHSTTVAHLLGIPVSLAEAHLNRFKRTYSRLFGWLKAYVNCALERGYAENVIGYRAAFTSKYGENRGHVMRSAQNFPVQSGACACFQLTGLYLEQMGADIRLPAHDAYLLSVPDDPGAIANTCRVIDAAAEYAVGELFPGLPPKKEIVTLDRFAKDGDTGSLERLIVSASGGSAHG